MVDSKNSLFYWYPKIKDLDIPMPETVMVPFPEDLNWISIVYERKTTESFDDYILTLLEAHEDSGFGLPFFMRTDETSNKHSWRESCYVTDLDQITSHIFNLLEHTEMSGWLGGLTVSGMVLREFLELDVRFKAHHGRMPIAKEFRFFVKNGEYQCHHPYWFPACMSFPSTEDWYEELMTMEKISETAFNQLKSWAELIGETVGGYWSIDFCKLKQGSWAMTDMALGKDSFHFNTCKYAPEEMKQYGDLYEKPTGFSSLLWDEVIELKKKIE